MPELVKSRCSVLNRPAVAPDYGRAKGLVMFIDTNKSVHLVRNTDGSDIIFIKWKFLLKFAGCANEFLPPEITVLLSKTRVWRLNFHFRCWRKSRCQRLT